MKLNGVEIRDAADMAPQQEDERWWGPPAYITFENQPDALLVHVTKRRRKGDVAIAVAMAIVGIVCFAFEQSRGAGFVLVFLSVMYLFHALYMTGTVMTVNRDGLWSTFTGRLFSKRAGVTWEKAGRLTYLTQTRNRPRGLYAKRSFISYTCLIPFINAKQVAEVSAKVYERFPQYKTVA